MRIEFTKYAKPIEAIDLEDWQWACVENKPSFRMYEARPLFVELKFAPKLKVFLETASVFAGVFCTDYLNSFEARSHEHSVEQIVKLAESFFLILGLSSSSFAPQWNKLDSVYPNGEDRLAEWALNPVSEPKQPSFVAESDLDPLPEIRFFSLSIFPGEKDESLFSLRLATYWKDQLLGLGVESDWSEPPELIDKMCRDFASFLQGPLQRRGAPTELFRPPILETFGGRPDKSSLIAAYKSHEFCERLALNLNNWFKRQDVTRFIAKRLLGLAIMNVYGIEELLATGCFE